MNTPIDAVELGFSLWRGVTAPMSRPHSHSEIEINYALESSLDYFLSGRFQTVQPRHLAVFWAGAPHQLLEEREHEALWITLPLAWFLQWNIDATFARRLLDGELLVQPQLVQPQLVQPQIEYSIDDETLLRRWLHDFTTNRSRFEPIILLELEARLRRLSVSLDLENPLLRAASQDRKDNSGRVKTERAAPGNAQSRQVERLASFLSRHYQEAVSVEDAAREVGLHPNYAMQIFKSGCGLTLGQYLQKLRLSHAQRLLFSTDWPLDRVAEASGFGSVSRFHATFKTQCGQTPRAFRLHHETTK